MTYKIEKGIEYRKGSIYPFKDMVVGDSFLVENVDKHASARAQCYLFGKSNDMTFKATKQDGGLRIFRTE